MLLRFKAANDKSGGTGVLALLQMYLLSKVPIGLQSFIYSLLGILAVFPTVL